MNLGDLKGLNMAEIVGKVAQMQKKMSDAQEAVGKITVEAEAGGGMVKVTATGAQRITAIRMEPEIVDPDDMEMLEDLIIAGVNKALEEAARAAKTEMQHAATDFLPPGMDLSSLGI